MSKNKTKQQNPFIKKQNDNPAPPTQQNVSPLATRQAEPAKPSFPPDALVTHKILDQSPHDSQALGASLVKDIDEPAIMKPPTMATIPPTPPTQTPTPPSPLPDATPKPKLPSKLDEETTANASRIAKMNKDGNTMTFHPGKPIFTMPLRPEVVTRPVVADFAQHMEHRLREFDEIKGTEGWKDAHLINLSTATQKAAARAEHALVALTDLQKVMQQAADLGNYAMMLWDRAQTLINKREAAKKAKAQSGLEAQELQP